MRSSGVGSFIGASLHDLNTVDAQQGGEMEGMSDIDREAITEDSLDNGDESNSASVVCFTSSFFLSFLLFRR
jgi:hypothetical protein